ncbi:MAG TPA: NAD(P)-binding domain-containing protein [Methyloceanibacter sp.]|nr:NAD(P)-binding domain-containing protein [Methyloceanibacter sp.]
MRIAIGAGNVGRTLGGALRIRGHAVVYGVRDPARSPERVAKPVRDALKGAELVILATPWNATEALVCEHAEELAGKIVIDATNPINPSRIRLAVGFDTSGAELLQGQARKATFFKAFNSARVAVMAKPQFPEGNAIMFVAGPGDAGKSTVLVEDVGFDAVDAGELKAARLLEPLAMLWLQPALVQGAGRDLAFVMARRDAANPKADSGVRMVRSHPQAVE